jgi:hypothetical protein
MDKSAIRLQCLEIASRLFNDIPRPSTAYLIDQAKALEAYALGNLDPEIEGTKQASPLATPARRKVG